MTITTPCGCRLSNCFHEPGQCTRLPGDNGFCVDCTESRDLHARIEIRKQEMVDQQTGFDVDGTLDDPELIQLHAGLQQLRDRNR
jgi:hypothetical protein